MRREDAAAALGRRYLALMDLLLVKAFSAQQPEALAMEPALVLPNPRSAAALGSGGPGKAGSGTPA